MTLGLTQTLTEMSTTNISWRGGYRLAVPRADNLATFMRRLSWNMGASPSWNPQGLSRPVMGRLSLSHCTLIIARNDCPVCYLIHYWQCYDHISTPTERTSATLQLLPTQ